MFHNRDTPFSCGRTLIVCLILQESFKVKKSSMHVIRVADTAFLLTGAGVNSFPEIQVRGKL